jgi:threonine dehydratase
MLIHALIIYYLKFKSSKGIFGGIIMEVSVKLNDVKSAVERLKGHVKHTPVLRGEKLDDILKCKVYFKPECLQITGSFKVRGATNKIFTLMEEERARGIIAASSGNHAQGVAYASKKLGIRATLILPENATKSKIEGTKALGAEVILHGLDSVQRYKKAYELIEQKGHTLVHSYNDPQLIAGQGTVGYEIIEDLSDVDVVVVPLGGGGLLSGVSVAVKEMNPKVRVIGVEPAAIPRYSESRAMGKPVEMEIKRTIADGLMVVKPGENNYPIIQKYVDDVVAVEDEYIYMAIKEILFKAKILAEPSAAIGVAAALAGKLNIKSDDKVCFVLTGGNIDPDKLEKFIMNKSNM